MVDLKTELVTPKCGYDHYPDADKCDDSPTQEHVRIFDERAVARLNEPNRYGRCHREFEGQNKAQDEEGKPQKVTRPHI